MRHVPGSGQLRALSRRHSSGLQRKQVGSRVQRGCRGRWRVRMRGWTGLMDANWVGTLENKVWASRSSPHQASNDTVANGHHVRRQEASLG